MKTMPGLSGTDEQMDGWMQAGADGTDAGAAPRQRLARLS